VLLGGVDLVDLRLDCSSRHPGIEEENIVAQPRLRPKSGWLVRLRVRRCKQKRAGKNANGRERCERSVEVGSK
jgi:hypothetical protein